MARLAAELLPQLTLGNAECAARPRGGPAHSGLLFDDGARFPSVEKGRSEAVGVVEILDERVRDALLTGRAAGAAVAAILRHQNHLAGVGDRLEQNVV